jgi:hypothetical protein
LIPQYSPLSFLAKVNAYATFLGHESNEFLGLVHVELVDHEDPYRIRIRGNCGSNMFGKINVLAGLQDARGNDQAACNVDIGDQA